jgi:hypothetical protein
LEQGDGPAKPWYKEFWAWFILAPLVSTVILSSIMLITAIKYGDDEIVDDYYKKGRMINQSQERMQLATQLGLDASVDFDLELGDVTLQLNAREKLPHPAQLTLFLDHAFNEQNDVILVMKEFAPGRYRADLSRRPQNRWYLRLEPNMDLIGEGLDYPGWRLSGEIDFARATRVQMQGL